MQGKMSLRSIARELGVSQPFLSQIRAGSRPCPEGLRKQLEAMGAYQSLIGDKQWAGGTLELGNPSTASMPEGKMVPRIRVELMTRGFSVHCSTTELPRRCTVNR